MYGLTNNHTKLRRQALGSLVSHILVSFGPRKVVATFF